MKIIKSFCLIAAGLLATITSFGQQGKNNEPPQVKSELIKQEEIKTPPKTGIISTPSGQAEFKPQPGTPLPKEAPVLANKQAQTSEEENSKAVTEAKNKVLDNDAPDNTKNLTPEQVNILNGKSERPKNSGAPVQHSAQQKTTQAQPVNQN